MTERITFPTVGFLYEDSDHGTPVPANLNFDTESGIQLEVPVEPNCVNSYARWFQPGGRQTPSYLTFKDSQAVFHLINCRNTGFAGTSGPSPRGAGYLGADYLIEDKDRHDGNFDEVHCMQSQVAGLHKFAGWKTSATHFEHDVDGLVKKVTITTETPESVPIGSVADFDVALQPYWAGGDETPGVAAIRGTTWIETRSKDVRKLRDHEEVHRTLRDLIALSYWQPADFTDHRVSHAERPNVTLSREPVPGSAWRPLYTIRPLRSHSRIENTTTVPAVSLDSLGANGLENWFDVHTKFRRVLDPLLGLLFFEQTTTDVAVMQTGVAMEAFGYIAALDEGKSERAAASRSYCDRVIAAASELPFELEDLVSEDLVSWAKRASDVYNGTKHANRDLPDGQYSALVASTLIIMIRLLIIRRIGVTDKELTTAKQISTPWWQLRQMYRKLQGDAINP